MDLNERIESFTRLGEILRNSLAANENKYSGKLLELINNQYLNNEWFTPDNVRNAVSSIAAELTKENLTRWTDRYPELNKKRSPVRVGVIMAGNIPLVGFHDFLSVLITGNNLIAKTSSKDPEMIICLNDILCDINPGFRSKTEFTESTLSNFDTVIATGSNNSSRYFEYYFNRYPNIIRKNRNSIAIIEGDESDNELEALGTDIFTYFGLGCRNVSKIYIPENYDLSSMTKKWDKYSYVTHHQKYANNYDFNKAVYIVNKEKFFDTGYLLLKEDARLSSPVSVLHYEYFKSLSDTMKQSILTDKSIQCVIGKRYTPIGKAQSPHLWDYADGIDTIEFLSKKNTAGIL